MMVRDLEYNAVCYCNVLLQYSLGTALPFDGRMQNFTLQRSVRVLTAQRAVRAE